MDLSKLKIEDLEEVTEGYWVDGEEMIVVSNNNIHARRKETVLFIKPNYEFGIVTYGGYSYNSNESKAYKIPTPQKREMNSLEVMEYLHLLQMNLSTGIIRVDNHPKGIVYSTHGHGLIVYDPDVESSDKKYSSYSEFNEYDKLKDCKFGILKNGEVTEFELPEIEV